MARRVALLRAINLGSHNKVPMARLKEVCEGLGWSDVATYIQSGNVVFSATGSRRALETALEHALRDEWDIDVPCIIRTAAEWRKLHAANPFPDATAQTPNLVMAAVSQGSPDRSAVREIEERARNGEIVAEAGGAIWIHYPGGSGRSAITPGLLDRAAGSPVTTRNARTVARLNEMLNGSEDSP